MNENIKESLIKCPRCLAIVPGKNKIHCPYCWPIKIRTKRIENENKQANKELNNHERKI